jgi:hypothetical protein
VKLPLRTLASVPAEYRGCVAGPGFLCAQTGDGTVLPTVRTWKKQCRLVTAKGTGCEHGYLSQFRVCGQETVRIFLASWIPGEATLGDAQMRAGVGLTFIAVGAIMIFALGAGGPHWINLRITGIVLVLAGALGIALPAKLHLPLFSRRYQARTGRAHQR